MTRGQWTEYLERFGESRYEVQASNSVARTMLTLPWPPSVNTYWRFVPGQPRPMISRDGRAYRKTVGRIVQASGAERLMPGRLGMLLVVYPPDRRRRDVDNLLKAILDSLGHAGVYADDELIDNLTVRRLWGTERAGDVDVTVKVIQA